MNAEFVIREIKNINQDAARLVAMWQASDDQWPGTWSGGAQITPQTVIERFERGRNLFVYVVETADRAKIVGYCSFSECEDDPGVGYVELLNVQPDYQGKSLARQLLCRCIDRCIELGFKQLTLHTWPGNLKSVPLYKKTGLYWVPDSSVHMRNFVPGILTMPCAGPYFEKHDWYKTFQRKLEQKEDDERWEGMQVFTYRWQAGDDMLTVWVDRQSRTITAVETNNLAAAAIVDETEPARGLTTQMRWKLTNKTNKPMRVSLIANGSEHLSIEHRQALTIQPGESAEATAPVGIAADAPGIQPGKPAPVVKTLFIIDGEVIELATGLHPRPAISVELAPRYVTLFPGVAQNVHLQLHNYIKREITATVSIAPTPGLVTDWTQKQITVPKKGWAGAPITLSAAQGGVYEIQTTIHFDDAGAPHRTQPRPLVVFSLPPGSVLAHRENAGQIEPKVRIENEWTRLIIESRGWMQIRAANGDASLGGAREFLGPPFWPSELEDKTFDVALERENGRITATLSVASDDYPGITLRRQVTLSAGPLIEIGYALINNGVTPYTLQMQPFFQIAQRDEATLTLPLDAGIVQSRMSEFPTAEEDVSKTPEAFAEHWAATTSQHGTIGLLWPDTVVENELGHWGMLLLWPKTNCEPQTWTPFGTFYLYAGPGDWRTVRAHSRRLTGANVKPEPIPVESRAVHDARLEPSPLITLDDQIKATLIIDNLRARSLIGQAILSLPQGVDGDHGAFEIKGATLREPFTQPLKLTVPPTAMAYEGHVSLQTQLFDDHIAVPIVRLGDHSEVQVFTNQNTWIIDNGRTRWTIAPDFAGAVISWQENGTNHLLSPYPEPKTFGWMNNWYGGLMPLARLRREMPGKLWQEKLAAQNIAATDARGVNWTGVRLSCTLEREKLAGLAIDLDYLTVGHSNVLKLVYRLHNLTTARRSLGYGWQTYWQPDGEWRHNVVRSEFVERKPTPWDSWSEAGRWGLATNAESGRTAILVSPYPDVRLVDWGDAGGHLGLLGELDVRPQRVAERVCYLGLCDNVQQARRYTCLKDYTN